MKKTLSFLLLFGALAALSEVAFGLPTRTRTDEVTSSSDGPVAFPSGFTAPTTEVGDLVTGASYSATLTAGANVAAVVTPVTLKYLRLGIYVYVFGQVSIDPTAGATLTTYVLSTPLLRSANFAGTLGAYGTTGLPVSVSAGVCNATNAAKTITCTYTSGGTAVELVNVGFWYTTTGN
jgi:hypothetical protein